MASVSGKPPAGVGGKKTIWSVKPADALLKDVEVDGKGLKRAVGALDLTALGVGAIIGTGIFVIIG